jgi:hypothetical protein
MTLTEKDLRQFSGTEHWYRHGLVRTVLYTDGVWPPAPPPSLSHLSGRYAINKNMTPCLHAAMQICKNGLHSGAT